MGRNAQGEEPALLVVSSAGATSGKGFGSYSAESKVLVNVAFRHTIAVRRRVWPVSAGVSVPLPGVGVLSTNNMQCMWGSHPFPDSSQQVQHRLSGMLCFFISCSLLDDLVC